MVTDCTEFVSIKRPNISTVRKQLGEISSSTETALEISLDIVDAKLKDAERKLADIEAEAKSVTAVEEAILREFLPKSLAEKVLLSISNGNDEKTALKDCFTPIHCPHTTICVVRLVNFYESTRDLPPDEVRLSIQEVTCFRLSQLLIVSFD